MSLLIRNVQVLDGEGKEPYKADVFIQKNIISAIGDLKSKDADQVIDGTANYLAPGFIDTDTSSDQYLAIITNPGQAGFLSQGVTTIVGGHCGSSLAPLLYGGLESIRKWTDTSKINVNWHTFGEFAQVLSALKLGVNFGTMIGHATIRRSINGGIPAELNSSETKVFIKILSKALEEGAFGMSTGLGYAHGRNVRFAEIDQLCAVVKKYGGLYSTHLRSETSGLIGAVEETIKISQEIGIRTVISHLRPLGGFEAQFKEAMTRINKSNAETLRFCVYPYDTSINPLYTILPLWAQERDFEAMLQKIRTPESAERIKKEMADFPMDQITVAEAPRHDYFVGKNISELAEMFGLTPIEAIIKLMDATNLRATIFNKNINFNELVPLLSDERALIASNGSSRSEPSGKFLVHERSLNTFPRFLELVVNNKSLTLPEAIKKITSIPARYFNIKDRGVLKEGKIADLTLIDKNDFKIKQTIVGGKISPETGGGVLKHEFTKEQ